MADDLADIARQMGQDIILLGRQTNGFACAGDVAALAGGATRIGVSDITEALALRRAGITAPILAWLHAPGTSFREAAAAGIELGISSFDQLQQASAAASVDRPVGVHLKLETGLGRNWLPRCPFPAEQPGRRWMPRASLPAAACL